MHAAAYRYHQSKHPPFTKDEEVAAAREIRRLRDAAWEAVLRSQSPDDLVAAFTFPEREEGEGHVGREIERAALIAFQAVKQCEEWTAWSSLSLPANRSSELLQSAVPATARDLAPLVSACDLDLLALARATDKNTAGWHALMAAVRRFESRNVGLVFHLSRKFWRSNVGFTVDDLVGFAFEGLRVGVLRFDPDRGTRFSTYASGWIRHRVGRAIDDFGRTIRLPVHVLECTHKAAVIRERAASAGLPRPTDEEVAAVISARTPKNPVSAEKVRRAVLACNSQPFSMETPLRLGYDHEDDRTVKAVIPDDAPGPDEEFEVGERAEQVRRALSTLSPRSREVLERRVENGEMLATIGQDFGLSRERVRQIEAEALMDVRLALFSGGKKATPVRRRRAMQRAEACHA